MKALKEDNDNKYAVAIRNVEDAMRDNEVSISYIGGGFSVTIKDKEFDLKGSDFPRLFDEERLTFDD
jgi:hypothetical protein